MQLRAFFCCIGPSVVGKKAFEITRCIHDRATTQPFPRHRPRASKRIKYWTLFCMIAFILACYGVLVYQLYVWQVRDAESYRAEAVTQQLKDTTLPAVRGSIYSANGKLLARAARYMEQCGRPVLHFRGGATRTRSAIVSGRAHCRPPAGRRTTADTVYKALTASTRIPVSHYQYRVVKRVSKARGGCHPQPMQTATASRTALRWTRACRPRKRRTRKDGEVKTSKANCIPP